MADYVIATDEDLQPEIALTAGQPVTVEIQPRGKSIISQVQIMVHSGDKPVYARTGTDVEVQGKVGSIIPPGTWYDLVTGTKGSQSVSIVSAAAATVSVFRS